MVTISKMEMDRIAVKRYYRLINSYGIVMSRKKIKPLGQLLIACYLLPLVCSLVFGGAHNEKQKMGFFLSISTASICSLVLYLTIKNWEHEWRQQAVQKKEELPAMPVAPQVDMELVKQKEEIIEQLKQEHQVLIGEKEKALQTHLEAIDLVKNALQNREKALQTVQENLLERTLQTQMQQRQLEANDLQIAALQTDITNLHFELKTLLKLEKK